MLFYIYYGCLEACVWKLWLKQHYILKEQLLGELDLACLAHQEGVVKNPLEIIMLLLHPHKITFISWIPF